MEKSTLKKMITSLITFMMISLFGIILMFRSQSIIVKIIGLILFIVGLIDSFGCLSKKQNKTENLPNDNKDVHLDDRSKYIIDKIGGAENIDIDLSKYDDRNQLIILKDKSILIGYNNYETEKIISFDSIINLDIKVKDIIVESEAGYKNYHRTLIESIFVYIHTHECTEELVFEYLFYKNKQEKYHEILKGLNRFKVMLEDNNYTNDLDKTTNINNIEKFIPEQIKKYKELLDMGAITESEYNAKKKELLSK